MLKKDTPKDQSNPAPVCQRCGKPLENMACPACNGKGYYRAFLFFKKECQSCQGSRRTLRCPDEFDHILEDFNVRQKVKSKLLYQEFGKGTSYKIRPTLLKPGAPTLSPATKRIPPPWHPQYPNAWHPMHPRSPLNPANPNSPFFSEGRLPGDSSTDAPPPDVKKKKRKGM